MPARRGRGRRACATIRFWSLGPRSSSCASDSSLASRSQTTGEPNRSSAIADLRPSRRSSVVQPPAYAGLERRRAARGRSWRCRDRGWTGRRCRDGSPTTSCESASSAIRRATRRLVLARRLSLMTPAGRCVARIRWMPSDRPRWAMSTTPSTNSGTSPASAANSSITITRPGGVSGSLALLELEQVLGLLAVEQVLAVVQLGAQARQRAPHEVRAEVGDEADGVRQLDAVGERRAALVVDEQERDPIGAVLRGHAEHPRLQELGLARAGGAADEGVRALRAQVERHRVGAALADERLERPGALQPGRSAAPSGRGSSCSAASAPRRPRRPPPCRCPMRPSIDTLRGRSLESSTTVLASTTGARRGEDLGIAVRDALDAAPACTRGRRGRSPTRAALEASRHVDERAARGGQRLHGGCDEDRIDAGIRSPFDDLREAGAVDGRVVGDEQHERHIGRRPRVAVSSPLRRFACPSPSTSRSPATGPRRVADPERRSRIASSRPFSRAVPAD